MSAYSDYLNFTRRLLHDSNGQFWTTSALLDYINRARRRVVRDTGAYRNLLTRNLVVDQETYLLDTGFTVSTPVLDVVNLTVHWGNSRLSLAYLPWSRFNSMARYWQNLRGRPTVFSVYAYTTVYIQPRPDQAYVCEWDCVVQPPDIVDETTVEVIPATFNELPPFYAARLAKLQEQSYGEAEAFNALYEQEKARAIGSAFTRRVRNPYAPR